MSSRTAQKQAARVAREQLAQQQRRRRTWWTSLAVVAALLAAALLGWGLYTGQQETGPVRTPPGAVDDGTAFAIGNGPVPIDVYADFLCPACKQFEQASGATLDQLVTEGKARVVYHPIAILDRMSAEGDYSTRAAAASACAAVGGRFDEYHKALFAQQPAEGGPGLTDGRLIELGTSVGLTGDFASCVRDGTYRSWAARATEVASGRGVTGTPTVLVAGKRVEQPAPAALTAAVTAATK